jgi:cell fate (sporulation/competence/biofilm development) regulator YmcA (YheA/YmcA/DUF963 family)
MLHNTQIEDEVSRIKKICKPSIIFKVLSKENAKEVEKKIGLFEG